MYMHEMLCKSVLPYASEALQNNKEMKVILIEKVSLS